MRLQKLTVDNQSQSCKLCHDWATRCKPTENLQNSHITTTPILNLMSGMLKEAAAAPMNSAISGSVMMSHFRRPRVSIVRIAGSAKMKLMAPFPLVSLSLQP